MTVVTAAQRALHAYLLAYRRQGLRQADVAALPLAETCDLKALQEAGLVELRWVPIAQPQEVEPGPPAPDAEPPMESAANSGLAVSRGAEQSGAPSVQAPAWTDGAKARFVAAIAAGKTQAEAHVAAGFNRDSTSAYYQRKKDPAFAAAWEAARKAAAAKQEAARPFAPTPPGSDSDVELDGARRPNLPGPAGDEGDGPLSQRARERPAARRKPALGEVAAEDRRDRLGHQGVAPGLSEASGGDVMDAYRARDLVKASGLDVFRAVGGLWTVQNMGQVSDEELISLARRLAREDAA